MNDLLNSLGGIVRRRMQSEEDYMLGAIDLIIMESDSTGMTLEEVFTVWTGEYIYLPEQYYDAP